MREPLFIIEMTEEDIKDLISSLDIVVKKEGISVAERISQLHKKLLSAKPKPIEPPKPSQEELMEMERKKQESLKKQLEEIVEDIPKPKSPKKKTSKKK